MGSRLREKGALIIGKTNLDEFGMGSVYFFFSIAQLVLVIAKESECRSFTTTSCFGSTRNPRNTQLSAGGSSGGSIASVAAGFCYG